MDDDLTPLPPPREGNSLIRDDLAEWQNTARLNWPWVGDGLVYTEGYRRGAQLLVEHVVKNQRDQNYLVYPIVFLYRHHIELALKHIIMLALPLIERQLTDAEKRHLFEKHRLDLLWQDLKLMFDDIRKAEGWGAPDPVNIEGIDDDIRMLTRLDPESSSFRYPRSKKGEPSLPPEVKKLNLRHFAEAIERLAHSLSVLDAAVCHIARSQNQRLKD